MNSDRTLSNKGLFLPTWIVVLVFTPIFGIGGSALGWVAYSLIGQGQALIKIDSKLDSNNALMKQSIQSNENRINRLENHVFDSKLKAK